LLQTIHRTDMMRAARRRNYARPTLPLDAAVMRQGALRETHLRYHLSTVALLSPAQLQRYAELRGYAGAPMHHHH
jgi:hypothetical protein